MSIDGTEIWGRIKQEELFPLDPQAPGARVERTLLLSPSLKKDLMNGPWNTPSEEVRLAADLRADLERFVSGHLLRVQLGGRELRGEDMKRLLSADEVWEFKSGFGRDGIRVFGRFAQKNYFVATNWQWRGNLGKYGSKQWGNEVRRCKAEWTRIFQTYLPHSGTRIDEYLDNAEDASLFY